MGPGGSLLRGEDGRFSHEGARALEHLHGAGVAVVLVSGRTRTQLTEVARVLGADSFIAELGALEAGYPAPAGMTAHEAIAATGIPAELLDREPGLAPHRTGPWTREGTHLFRGTASPGAAAWVHERSGGTLRLADNGIIAPGGVRAWHLAPAGAGKGRAALRDARARGADPARCLGVGNSAEDLELAGVLGRFALVANALDLDPALAGAGVPVTRASYGAGVLEAVEDWLRG
jgi:hydroxymethylpyrimidine pyrophosphatase-like HAD family hydrolase